MAADVLMPDFAEGAVVLKSRTNFLPEYARQAVTRITVT